MVKHYEGPFSGWLQQRPPGPLPLETVAHLIRQAAAILQNAHKQGIVHKNITLDSFFVRVTNEQADSPELLITGFGQAQGNPISMAPEQWHGTAIPASDQYALAIIAYQLLTWHAPFQGSPEQLKYQHLNIQPRPPSQLNPHIPSGIDIVVCRTLAKRPEERFPTISAFADAFQKAIQGSTLLPRTSSQQMQPDFSVRHQSAPGGILRSNAQQAPAVLPSQSTHPSSAASQIREIVILGLVFLLVVGGIGFGFFSVIKNSQLAASSINTNSPVGTPVSSPIAFPSTTITGIPYLEDSLSSNSAGRWLDDGSACTFKNGTYHALVQQAHSLRRCHLTSPLVLTNVAIEVDVALLTGDNAGIFLRDDGNVHFYDFEITNTRHFYFMRRDSDTAGGRLISERPNSAVAPLGQKNTLFIIAKDNDFKLFINGVFVGEVHDNTYASGDFSLVVGTYAPTTTIAEASFSNLKIFTV